MHPYPCTHPPSTSPKVRGADSNSLAMTCQSQRDIWLHQMLPPRACQGRRLLLVPWSTGMYHGVGSQVHLMGAFLGLAMLHNRTLVPLANSFDRANHPHCQGRFTCTVCPLPSSLLSQLPIALLLALTAAHCPPPCSVPFLLPCSLTLSITRLSRARQPEGHARGDWMIIRQEVLRIVATRIGGEGGVASQGSKCTSTFQPHVSLVLRFDCSQHSPPSPALPFLSALRSILPCSSLCPTACCAATGQQGAWECFFFPMVSPDCEAELNRLRARDAIGDCVTGEELGYDRAAQSEKQLFPATSPLPPPPFPHPPSTHRLPPSASPFPPPALLHPSAPMARAMEREAVVCLNPATGVVMPCNREVLISPHLLPRTLCLPSSTSPSASSLPPPPVCAHQAVCGDPTTDGVINYEGLCLDPTTDVFMSYEGRAASLWGDAYLADADVVEHGGHVASTSADTKMVRRDTWGRHGSKGALVVGAHCMSHCLAFSSAPPFPRPVHWWRAQAVRFMLRWPSAHLCHVINQQRHTAYGMHVANRIASFHSSSHSTNPPSSPPSSHLSSLHAFSLALQHYESCVSDASPAAAATASAASASPNTPVDPPATASTSWHRMSLPSTPTDLVREPYMQRPIVSMHVRQSDKLSEMRVLSLPAHMFLAYRLRRALVDLRHVWLNTEAQSVINETAHYPDWHFLFATNARQPSHSERNREYDAAQSVAASLASALIAAQCDGFIGSLGSNWSRLINELRATNGRLYSGLVAMNLGEW
ncbi:unnamed protein product [Closterium sp. NIES-64]|nr:unnamed protein product [Closterium sp. NIES-64]